MTDPPTLFLNTSQVRPTWTNNGLTLALNLGSTHGTNVSCTGHNIYEAQTFAGANEATAGALFAPVVDQGHAHPHCTTPVRVALSSGPSNWTQTTSISESGISTGIGSATITTSDCTSLASSVASSVATGTSVASLPGGGGGADPKTRPPFRPIAMKKDVSGTPCQVAEVTTSSLYNNNGDSLSPSNTAGGTIATSFKSQQQDLVGKSNMVTVVAASSGTATSTTSAISSNGTSTGAGLVPSSVGSSYANTMAASTSITLSSAGIPVGIAIARQRYVTSSETVLNKQSTTPFKDTGNASCSAAAVVAPSSSASYSSVIPCHSTILSSGFAATPLGVIAESINCPTKHSNEMAPTVTNLQPFWSTQTGGISGTATLPMSIAQPQQTQTQQPSATSLPISIPAQTQQSAQTLTAQSSLAMPHQHAAVSQWHSYTGAALESQITTGMPSTCGGFQIARDSVSGQIILIPTGQIGVMMPCGLAKSSPLQHNNASAAIGQQLISANNSSFSLVQQLTSSNVHNSNVNIPHHFSTISSSGSLVIQQISGNTVPSPLLNHVNNSLLISAEAAATQSILNAQTPQYVPNNTSFLFNAQQLTSSTSSSSTLSSVPESTVVSSYADGSTPSSTSFIISTSCANRNDLGTGISLATSGPSIIPIDGSNTSSTQFKIANSSASCGIPAAVVSTPMTVIASSTGTNCTPTLSSSSHSSIAEVENDDDGSIKCHIYTKSSDDPLEQQITLIKATEESWSVQDAGNQTETNEVDPDGCLYDSDKKSIESDSSEESTRLKIDQDHEISSCESDAEEDCVTYQKEASSESVECAPAAERTSKAAEIPDFSGLQLLLNGIEQVEHVRETGPEVPLAIGVAGSDEDTPVKNEPISTQPANGLEILCALADQRFYEENEDDKEGCSKGASGTSKKRSAQQRLRDSFDDDKISSYRYKNDDDSPIPKSSRLFDSKHERSVSPYEGNQLKMRLELARLQKKYRETRKVLDRLTHGKYATVSSSSTRSPTPLKDITATTGSSEPDCDSKPIATPVKRRPGRPRKYSDPSLAPDKSSLSSSSSTSLQRSTPLPSSKSLRPKPKLKFESIQDSSPDKMSSNGDLSPPVLEPMCSSSPKVSKPFKSAVLSPPTLLPSKKSQRLQSPFYSRTKRSYVSRDGLDGFSSSEPEDNDDDEIYSEEDDYERSKRGVYSNDALKVRKNFYKSGYLEENGKDANSGLKRPMPEKRKVGRPRKYPKVEPQNQTNTETISCKNQNKGTSRFLTGVSKFSKYISSAMLESQRKPIHSSQYFDKECKPKITPKLKAEAKLKTWRHESPSPEANSPNDSIDCPFLFTSSTTHKSSNNVTKTSKNLSASDDDEEVDYLVSRTPAHRPSTRIPSDFTSIGSKSFTNSKFDTNSCSTTVPAVSSTTKAVTAAATTTTTITGAARDTTSDDFRITPKLLEEVETNPLRVLIAVGGLFRAGELSAVRAPDLYGIKVDGERGHRTHIYTKEEVLRDVVLEVEGKYPLKNGTRVCAFWSSQYLSLYPGYVTSFSSSDESEDECFTSVEFDDGDSGRINIKDIRLLPKNFSLSRRTLPDDLNTRQYQSNHDHHKRKRRISGVSFEEIPVDKQLRSPKSLSLSPEGGAQDEESSESRRISAGSSTRKSFTEYDTGSRSSSFDQNEPESRSNFEPSTTSGDEVAAAKVHRREEDNQDGRCRVDSKNTPQKKHLKKKRKDKLRAKDSASSSFKRKSHKCGDNDHDPDSRKLHKRHKHKHKHRKHHKRKRSSSSERKYATTEDMSSRISKQISSEDRETNVNLPDILEISCRSGADCLKESCCNKNNNNSSKNGTCACKTKRNFNEKQAEATPVPLKDQISQVDKVDVKEQIISTMKKEEIHQKIESSKHDAAGLVGQKQSISHEEDNKPFNSAKKQLSGSESKPVVFRKTVRPQSTATIQPSTALPPPLLANHKQSSKPTTTEVVKKEVKQKEEEDDDEVEVECDDEEGEEVEEEESSEDSPDNQDEANSGDNFWEWCGKGFKRNGKGRAKKEFFQAIKRGDVDIRVGDCAVFLTADNSPKPFIGRIKSMWESYGNMMVLVKWFYHPEETSGLKEKLPFLGGLFESPHDDKNDVQTISHKCEVVSIKEYRERLKKEPERLHNVYQSNDVYYLAGHYDPTNKRLTLEKDVVS